jgi:drug/metabolite transporter (DMT)-like permease
VGYRLRKRIQTVGVRLATTEASVHINRLVEVPKIIMVVAAVVRGILAELAYIRRMSQGLVELVSMLVLYLERVSGHLVCLVAAVGNAFYAWGQRKSVGLANSLLVVAGSAGLAALMALLASPAVGPVSRADMRHAAVPILFSGFGLFLCYVGFNLLYSRYGTAWYVVYAAIAIVTTTVVVGWVMGGEPANRWHYASLGAALISVMLFQVGQSQR